jgi:pyruvate dehydrogenase E2 component (dihydrolipoyllysine-residue acetyltransferase)
MREFDLPSLGADMDKGTLIEWRVQPGDTVKRGQVVALVDTTKAAIEVECWDEGTVDELLVQPDTEMPVGTPMLLLREDGETVEQAAQWKREHRAAASPTPAAATAAVASKPALQPSPMPAAPTPSVEVTRRRVSPAARKHAAEKGVNLDMVTGTGPHGAVTVEDIERVAKQPARPATTAPAAPTVAVDRAGEMRKTIAAAMARSKREIPHYYLAADIPLAAATRWLAAENEKRPVTERLLMAVLLIKGVAKGLEKIPELNGFYRDGRFKPSSAIHVGVAISLRQGGLIAPALLDANQKPLDQLMKELNDLVKRARAFSLKSSEMSRPTVTVTNLGDQGVESMFAVIYPPQVAIIGFGSASERAQVVDGAIQALPVVTASLSADHRVSDGHRGALFLKELKVLLQQPERL